MNRLRHASVLLVLTTAACSSSSTPWDAPYDAPTEAAPDVIDTFVPETAPPVDVIRDTGVDAVDVDMGVDVPRFDVPLTGMTLTYVVDDVTIDMTDSTGVPHTGLNLDALFSDGTQANGCNHQDFGAMYDNDQNCATPSVDTNGLCTVMPNPGCAASGTACTGGVDNQMPTLANTIATVSGMDVRQLLATEVATSRFVVLIRLESVDDLVNDPDVAISVYRGFSTFSTGCTSVTAGREYQVARSSLTPGGTTLDDAFYRVQGSIVNGRLIAPIRSDTLFPVVLPFSASMTFALNLHGFALRGDITAGSLDRATMAGWALGNEVRDEVAAAYPMYATIVGGVIGGLVDIQIPLYPMPGICDAARGSMHDYGAISAGFGIHAVPATISPTAPIADAAMPGTCSAM